jgi:hypothetical protein
MAVYSHKEACNTEVMEENLIAADFCNRFLNESRNYRIEDRLAKEKEQVTNRGWKEDVGMGCGRALAYAFEFCVITAKSILIEHKIKSGWNPIPTSSLTHKRRGLDKDLAIGRVCFMRRFPFIRRQYWR